MSAPTLVASPPRPLKQMKSSRYGLSSPSSCKAASTFSAPSKRSFAIATDENCDPSLAFLANTHKRVKSAAPKSATSTLATPTATTATTTTTKTTKTATSRRAFGTLIDITNIHASPKTPSKGRGSLVAKSPLGKPARSILKPLSQIKKPASPKRPSSSPSSSSARRAPSPRVGTGRGIRRAYSPPRYKRIDPPFRASLTPSSIDSLLFASSTSVSRKPQNDSSSASSSALTVTSIPDSWVFDIYEDSPEETLQNLMEHSTHALDISDDDDAQDSDTSELLERGKENIPPARLAEIMSAAAEGVGAHAMNVEADEKRIPQRRRLGRQALREMRKEELEEEESTTTSAAAAAVIVADDGVKIPSLKEFEFATGCGPQEAEEQVVATTPKSPASPGFVFWESDHEDDEEVAIACRVPLPAEDGEI